MSINSRTRMALAVVAEIGAAARVVGSEPLRAIGDGVIGHGGCACNRSSASDGSPIYRRRRAVVVRARGRRVVGVWSVAVVVRRGERAAHDRTGNEAGADAPTPSAPPLHGL